MNCPSKEILQDLIDGVLSEATVSEVTDHVKSCDTCKQEVIAIHAVYEALDEVVNEEHCPSLETLEAYGRNTMAESEITEVERHVELCSRCRSLAWAFGASEEELADWQRREELEHNEFKAKDFGYNTVKDTLQKLLPARIDLLEKGWESILAFVLDLKDKALESWPSFDQRTQLVGVLGFAEASDPETDAASIIMATTLYVSQLVSDGKIKPHQKDIEAAIEGAATKLGAGKELRRRLIETVPPIVLKFS